MAEQHGLGRFVRRFLLEELIDDRNLSINTQRSYRDCIRLLLRFLADKHRIDPTRVTIEQVSPEVVREFLANLEQARGNSTSSRNQRLAAIHSLFRFIGREVPELVDHAAQIRSIPPRRTASVTMAYLDKPEVDAMLAVPDRTRAQGRRDYALLLFLYNTGARASEAASANIGDLHLDDPSSARFLGKGRKVRHCPLWPHTVDVLRQLLGPRLSGPAEAAVFLNVRGQRITRFGAYALVQRTVRKATATVPSLATKQISPHTMRHTTAVHLLRAGVEINTIRAWLGHVDIETTNRYAEIDLEMKAKALAACSVDATPSKEPEWHKDSELLAFLTSL
jgi:site-specific recombinase XerD